MQSHSGVEEVVRRVHTNFFFATQSLCEMKKKKKFRRKIPPQLHLATKIHVYYWLRLVCLVFCKGQMDTKIKAIMPKSCYSYIKPKWLHKLFIYVVVHCVQLATLYSLKPVERK